jgi:hypothetical protein
MDISQLSTSSVVLPVLSALGVYGAYRAASFVFAPTPLSALPGPASPSWLWGHMGAILRAENSALHEEWTKEYGHVLRYFGLFSVRPFLSPRLLSIVLTCIAHRGHVWSRPT